jgi:hypothetical protein
MLTEKNAHFLTTKQGIFRWTDKLSSFEEGDAKDSSEIRTGDLQIQKLALDHGIFTKK